MSEAYQLKITIEDSKPAVYRRVLVPAWLTFEQLHQVIQIVFGWEDMHLHEFSFPSLNISFGVPELDEGKEALDFEECGIRSLLKRVKRFTYRYDFGDDWKHRIVVEKVLPDYEAECPVLLDYSGDNFVEDSGGVWASFHADALYEMTRKEEGRVTKEEMNDWLSEVNWKNPYWNSKFDRIDMSLVGILESFTRTDLMEMARENRMKGYSKLKKQELVAFIEEKILDKEGLYQKFLVATEDERKRLEQAIEDPVVVTEGYLGYNYWQKIGVVYMTVEGAIHVPDEIRNAYAKVKENTEYRKEKGRYGKVDEFLRAFVNLYGIIKVKKAADIINSKGKLGVTEEELLRWCSMRDQYRDCQFYFLQDGWIMNEVYGDNLLGVKEDYHKLMKEQQGKSYYVPEEEELLRYADGGYVEENKSFLRMCSFLEQKMHILKKMAYEFCADIQICIRSGMTVEEVISECERTGLLIKSSKVMNEFIGVLSDMYNNTRIAQNKGYTPQEMQRRMDVGRSGREPAHSNVIMFPLNKK